MDQELAIRSNQSLICRHVENKGNGLVAVKQLYRGQLIMRNEVLVESIDEDTSYYESEEERKSLMEDIEEYAESEQDMVDEETHSDELETRVDGKMAVNLLFRYSDWLNHLYCPPDALTNEAFNLPMLDSIKQLKPDVTEEQWRKAIATIQFNTFAYSEFTVLHGLISLINHSCTPNCAVVGNALYALRDINPEEEITVSYYGDEFKQKSFSERQQLLEEGWQFSCTCALCTLQMC